MREIRMNTLGVIHNVHQQFADYKRVLTVCSGGCLRSPTAAVVLAQDPFNFNTRAAGLTTEFAIVVVDDILMEWADEIVVMESWMENQIRNKWEEDGQTLPIVVLDIPDKFAYRDPALMQMIKDRYLVLQSYE